MLKVLDTRKDLEQRSVIDVLERALVEARNGDISAVALSFLGQLGTAGYYVSEIGLMGPGLLGAVSLMQNRLCEEMWAGKHGDVDTEHFSDTGPDPEESPDGQPAA